MGSSVVGWWVEGWAKVGSHEYDMNQVCVCITWWWTLASSCIEWSTKRMGWCDGGQRNSMVDTCILLHGMV